MVERTLRDIDVTARKPVKGGKAGVHINTMLHRTLAGFSPEIHPMRTESKTCPKALSSVSTLPLSAMSSCSESCSLGTPFV